MSKSIPEGRIEKSLSGFYDVNTGSQMIVCRARGLFRKTGLSPLVGDRVTVQLNPDGSGTVQSVLPRKNAFARPAVANIDRLVMIASGAVPVTDPFLIDRMLSVAALKSCDALIVLNKCDLNPADELFAIYSASGIPVLRVSALTGTGIDALAERIAGKLSVFTGNSGVGKSAVLNALDPSFRLRTGTVSRALGRGRHTTRHVELFTLSNGAAVIDTPGFSSFDSAELNLELKERLPETFPEFVPYLDKCRFTGCSHTRENGCAVLQAVRDGAIHPSRHAGYVRLYNELKDLRPWNSKKKTLPDR